MLVRLLSFIATVLGTARYKAVFLSCLTLVFALTGVTAMAVMYGGAGQDNTSSAVEQNDKTAEEQDLAPQLGGVRKQATKEQPSQQQTSQPPAGTSQETPNNPPDTAAKPPDSTFDIVLSTATELTLAPDTTVRVDAGTSDGSTVAWSVVPENQGGVQVITSQDNPNGFTFQIKADKDAAHGTYQFVITAKDAARTITVSKTITITIR